VKLSSPNLNYIIIAGAILMYASVYIYLLPSETEIFTHVRCIVSQLGRKCLEVSVSLATHLGKGKQQKNYYTAIVQ
jgi:hypothetical protein